MLTEFHSKKKETEETTEPTPSVSFLYIYFQFNINDTLSTILYCKRDLNLTHLYSNKLTAPTYGVNISQLTTLRSSL